MPSQSCGSSAYTPAEQSRRQARIHAERRKRWEDDLYRLMGEMQVANGDNADDVEALVRIAWKTLYEKRARLERGGAVS